MYCSANVSAVGARPVCATYEVTQVLRDPCHNSLVQLVMTKCCRKMQVSQLAGYVSEHSAYHHGDVSLTTTIVGMAQNFVGSNNINLLYPSGKPAIGTSVCSHRLWLHAHALQQLDCHRPLATQLVAVSGATSMADCNCDPGIRLHDFVLQVSLVPGSREAKTAPVLDTSSHV